MKNGEIILRAMLAAEVITMDDVKNGNVPTVHTFDEWKKNGRTVKKGQRAMFSAMIWKFAKKNHRLTAEEADAMSETTGEPHIAGETVERDGFILARAHFFSLEQTEESQEDAEIEIPADCTRTTEGRCEWISGNTKPIKEQLKAAGYRYSRRAQAWYKFTSADVAEPVQLGIFTDESVNIEILEPVTALEEGDKVKFMVDAYGITAGTVKIVDSYDGFQLWFKDNSAIIGFLERDFEKLQKVA